MKSVILQGCQGFNSMQGVATASGGTCFDEKWQAQPRWCRLPKLATWLVQLRTPLGHCSRRNGERHNASRVPFAGVFQLPGCGAKHDTLLWLWDCAEREHCRRVNCSRNFSASASASLHTNASCRYSSGVALGLTAFAYRPEGVDPRLVRVDEERLLWEVPTAALGGRALSGHSSAVR